MFGKARSVFLTFLFLNWFQVWSQILGGYDWGIFEIWFWRLSVKWGHVHHAWLHSFFGSHRLARQCCAAFEVQITAGYMELYFQIVCFTLRQCPSYPHLVRNIFALRNVCVALRLCPSYPVPQPQKIFLIVATLWWTHLIRFCCPVTSALPGKTVINVWGFPVESAIRSSEISCEV